MDVVIAGDFVIYDLNDDGTGVITEITERKNYLSRKAPKIKGGLDRGERYEQVVASNIDHVYIVSSTIRPEFNNRFVDRMIVAAQSNNLPVSLVINKTDLLPANDFQYWVNIYKDAGYDVFLTSTVKNKGIRELKKEISGNTNIFWGYSGVGKSSLINAMFPEMSLKTGDISDYSNKGKHTTVTALLIKVDENTFLVDTPGIRELDPYGIRKEDLSHYFNEFAEIMNDCRFNTCTHHHEPGCAVIEAVENGTVSVERYGSYLNILENIEEDMCFQVRSKK